MAPPASLLSGARILVTGADGFVGSHLCERLVELGARVTAWIRPTSVSGTDGFFLRNLRGVETRLAGIVAVDVAGPEAAGEVRRADPEFVFHLAAEAYVPRSFEQPRTVVNVNVGGTLAMLEGARELSSLRRVVVASSSEVYGPARAPAIDEDHPLEPTSPYAASKLAADRLAVSYFRTYDLPVTVLRPFNTYGPRHVYDVIPKFIRRALAGEALQVHGDGQQTRDFTYVSDIVEAYCAVAAADGLLGEVLNAGSGTEVSVREIAGKICELTGSDSPIEHDGARAAEVSRLCCDAGRLRAATGWMPVVDLEEGLRRNIAWARGA